MPYTVLVGVAFVSLLALLMIGGEAWPVPVIVLPLTLAYFAWDRKKLREDGPEAGG
jgi:hypothetical protein